MLPTLLLLSGAASADPIVIHHTNQPVRIDGVLDEAAWQSAPLVDDFQMHLPEKDGLPPGPSEVRVMQDEQYVYFGVRFVDGDSAQPAWLSARDDTPDKRFAVILDTNRDRQSATVLFLNALGVQQDFMWYQGGWNVEFDLYFQSKGRQTEDGFELEIAVPFRSLSYASEEEQTWGIIFLRSDPSLGHHYSTPHLTDALFVDPRMLEHTADLVGVRPSAPGVGVEAIATMTGVQAAARGEDGALSYSGAEPWHDAVRPGAELRLRVTPDVQLGVVGNPDFSDVESDATRFNLNERFTWQRPENRNFFTTDANRFGDELSTLYTRGLVQPVYGARFAGVSGPATFGVLNVLDRAPSWSLDWDGSPGWDEADVQGAMAATTFARMKVRIQESDVGILAAEKRLIGGSGGTNTVSGADLRVPITDKLYAVGAAQRSVTTDASGTATDGHRVMAVLTQPSGSGLRWRVATLDVSEAFRAETAFMPDSGLNLTNGYVERFLTPGGRIENITPRMSGYLRLDRDGEVWHGQEFRTALTVNGIHKLTAQVSNNQVQLNAGDSGPMLKGQLEYTKDAVTTWSYNLGGSYGQDWHWGASAVSVGARSFAGLTLRTRSNLFLTTTTEVARVDPKGADPEQAATLRALATWQLTPGVRLRVIEEVGNNTAWDQQWLTSSALLHLQARVRTEAWLGYSERRDLLAGESEEHIVFVKLSGSLQR